MINAIVFDIDGTLLDHEHALSKSLFSLYSLMKNGIPHVSFNEFFTTWKMKTDQYINEYLDGRISFEQQRILRVQKVFEKWDCHLSTEKAKHLFKQYLVNYEQNWILYDDVVPCLAMLKSQPLGIISDGDGEQQREKLAYTEIISFFSSIIISGEVGLRKPAPEIFKKCAKELNFSLDEILYIGDQLEKDVLGAINAGTQGVWIDRTNQGCVDSKIITISKLTELPEIIRKFQE